MHLILLFAFALQSLGAAPAEPVRGSLCVGEPASLLLARHCRSVEGVVFEVEADPDERAFAWISSDHSTIALGVVPAGGNVVTLLEGPSAMNLQIKGSTDRDWPQSTALTIATREKPGWRIQLNAIEVVSLRTIVVPPGTWDVRIAAVRHAGTTLPRQRILSPLDLGVIRLDPLPQIRGTVIDREGEFIRAAVMISDAGEMLATSDNFGEILYEAPCTGKEDCVLPERFRIEYPGTAPAWFAVTNRRRDLDFETLRLAKGGTLRLELDRSAVKAPLSVAVLDDPTATIPAPPLPSHRVSDAQERVHRWYLLRDAPELVSPPQFFSVIDSAVLEEDQSSVTFDNLPEGQLRVVLRGRDEGEYLSRFFHVSPGETREMEIAIQPVELTAEVIRDGKPIEGVPVRITQWDAPGYRIHTPPTDDRGRSTITVWEKGKHSAQVLDPDIRAAIVFEMGEQKEQNVRIEVLPASVSGRIVEAGSDKPLAGVPILLEDLFYRGDSAPGAVTDDDGRFEIESVMTGLYSCELRVEGYLPISKRGVITPGYNDLKTIRLARGSEYRITVIWEDGTPIPGAVYMENTALHGRHVADVNGEIRFRRAVPSNPVPFWIVPFEGSFARGERWFDREITIRVQRPGEKLILDFQDADKEPVNFVHASFRWNGHSLPRETRQAIESIQNKRFRSGASSRLTLEGMPPGLYSVSALQSVADNPWLPEWPRPPFTSVHYSGMEQTAKVMVPEPPPER